MQKLNFKFKGFPSGSVLVLLTLSALTWLGCDKETQPITAPTMESQQANNLAKTTGTIDNGMESWNRATDTLMAVPYTRAVWSNPYARNAYGNGAPKQAQVAYGNSRCPYSDVDYYGGKTYGLQAGDNVRRDTPEGTFLWR